MKSVARSTAMCWTCLSSWSNIQRLLVSPVNKDRLTFHYTLNQAAANGFDATERRTEVFDQFCNLIQGMFAKGRHGEIEAKYLIDNKPQSFVITRMDCASR